MDYYIKDYSIKKSMLMFVVAIILLFFSFCFKSYETYVSALCKKYQARFRVYLKETRENKHIGDFMRSDRFSNKVHEICTRDCILAWALKKDKTLDRTRFVTAKYGAKENIEIQDILGANYIEIAESFVLRIKKYYQDNQNYASGEKRYKYLGLSENQWLKSHYGVNFDFNGAYLYLRPATGFVFKVNDMNMRLRILTPESNWPLINNVETGKWYLRYDKETEEVLFDTLQKKQL